MWHTSYCKLIKKCLNSERFIVTSSMISSKMFKFSQQILLLSFSSCFDMAMVLVLHYHRWVAHACNYSYPHDKMADTSDGKLVFTSVFHKWCCTIYIKCICKNIYPLFFKPVLVKSDISMILTWYSSLKCPTLLRVTLKNSTGTCE